MNTDKYIAEDLEEVISDTKRLLEITYDHWRKIHSMLISVVYDVAEINDILNRNAELLGIDKEMIE